jgi:hypothetical protein
MSTLRAICEEAAKIRRARAGLDDKVAERIASGGRKPSYAPSLSNNLPEGNNKPRQSAPGVYEDWIGWRGMEGVMKRTTTVTRPTSPKGGEKASRMYPRNELKQPVRSFEDTFSAVEVVKGQFCLGR